MEKIFSILMLESMGVLVARNPDECVAEPVAEGLKMKHQDVPSHKESARIFILEPIQEK